MIWIRRTAAILLLGLGIALLLLPFPAELRGERKQAFVDISVEAPPYSRERVEAELAGPVIQVAHEDLEGQDEMQHAVQQMWGDSGTVCVLAATWAGFLNTYGLTSGDGLVILYRDGVHRVTGIYEEEYPGEGLNACVELEHLGAYDNREWNPMDHVEPEALADYPELAAELRRLAALDEPATGGRGVPVSQWRRFHRRNLDDLDFRPAFVAFDRLFRGAVDTEMVPWTLATPWLRNAAIAVGVAALLLALSLLSGVYRATGSRPGVAVCSTGVAVFGDVVATIGAALGCLAAVDGVFTAGLGMPSMIGLDTDFTFASRLHPLHFVSYPGLALGLPILTFWVSVLTAQRVHADAEGVTSYGAILRSFIPWNELNAAGAREQHSLLMHSTFDFRSLQTVLDLESDNVTLTINQPSSRARRQRVVATLLDNAPPGKRELIENAVRDW